MSERNVHELLARREKAEQLADTAWRYRECWPDLKPETVRAWPSETWSLLARYAGCEPPHSAETIEEVIRQLGRLQSRTRPELGIPRLDLITAILTQVTHGKPSGRQLEDAAAALGIDLLDLYRRSTPAAVTS